MNLERKKSMRRDATTVFELVKGFDGETQNNAMKAALDMAAYVLELTSDVCVNIFKNRQKISLSPNYPNRYEVIGGVDCYDDIIKLEFEKSKYDPSNIIHISLISSGDKSFSMPISFNEVGIVFVDLSNRLENLFVEHHFEYIEFKSNVAIVLLAEIKKQPSILI